MTEAREDAAAREPSLTGRALHEVRRVSGAALLALPAGLVLYFAFDSGGFYPGAPAYVAVLLCVVLALRVAAGLNPFASLSLSLGLAAGALALYSLLTLVSGAWSHAPGVARVEFDLPLTYLLAMLVCGTIVHRRARLRWVLRGLAAAMVVICTCGLITRLLPHVWAASPELENNRLSFPVTYWNTLGLVAAFGIVLCAHLSSDLEESRGSRIIAAAAVPLLAATLFFTFSRGAIATCVIAIIVYALVGRPRGMLSSVLSVAPATALTIALCYRANLLGSPTPTTAGAVAQGHHLALALAGCIAGAAVLRLALELSLDERVRRFTLSHRVRRRAVRAGWISVGVAAAVAIVVLNGEIASDYHRFLSPSTPGRRQDFRARLTDPANDGRIAVWKIAWNEFRSAPALGHGAGTFAYAWARQRPYDLPVRDAHSLYVEALDELGIVGLLLVLIPIVTVLARVAMRARGPSRPLYAAVFAVLLAWAIHAGIDWDWEMPVVTVVFFALGGLALARRPRRSVRIQRRLRHIRPRARSSVLFRASVAVACLLVALLPAYVWLSQSRLDDAYYFFARGNCASARAAARSSVSVLGNRAEPYEVLGYCDLRLGKPRAALASIDKAVALDPQNWSYAYSLAVLRAATGLDPRAAAAKALALNPRDTLVRAAWQMFHAGDPATWRAEGTAIAHSLTTL